MPALRIFMILLLLCVSVLLKPLCPWLDWECDHGVLKNVWLRKDCKTHLIHRRFADHVSASPRLHLSWAAIPYDRVHNVMSAVPTAYLFWLYVFIIGWVNDQYQYQCICFLYIYIYIYILQYEDHADFLLVYNFCIYTIMKIAITCRATPAQIVWAAWLMRSKKSAKES